MSKAFEAHFCEPVKFVPDGLYLGKFVPRNEALKFFREFELEYYGETEIKLGDIKEAYVRFQPTPSDMRDELQDMAWMVCSKTGRNAQPCWVIE